MGLLAFPGSGTLDFNYVGLRTGPTYDLRGMAAKYNLSAPDVFPDDFYGKTYLETPGNFTTSSSSGVITIGIIAYGSWTISENAIWITGISPSSGSGTGTTIINMNKTSNTGSSRTGTVTLTLTATGETVNTVITQSAGGVSTTAVQVGVGTNAPDACGNSTFPVTRWVPAGQSLQTATAIYSNSSGTTLAAAAYYSNEFGEFWRQWNGSSFIQDGFCFF